MKKIIMCSLVVAICVSLTGCVGIDIHAYKLARQQAENMMSENDMAQKGREILAKKYPKVPGSAVNEISKLEIPELIEEYEENKIKTNDVVLEVPGEERYEITYYYVSKDKYDENVITIEYEFTNLSKWDRAGSVFDSVVSIYQNDIKLDYGLLTKLESEWGDAARPGGTITGIRTYQLVDDESDIVFDMTAVDGYERLSTGTLKIK